MSYRFSAMLHVPGDVREAIAFYGRAFGATIGWSTPMAADMVAQLLVHGAEFWVHTAGEEIGNSSPEQLGGTPVRLMLISRRPGCRVQSGCGCRRDSSLAHAGPRLRMA